jgi:hypothetical protein
MPSAAPSTVSVITQPVPETRVITDPIIVEADPPPAGARNPDGVSVVTAVCDVQGYHDVVERSALRPPVVGDELVGVVDVKDVQPVTP